jgi:hypothetical protein
MQKSSSVSPVDRRRPVRRTAVARAHPPRRVAVLALDGETMGGGFIFGDDAAGPPEVLVLFYPFRGGDF